MKTTKKHRFLAIALISVVLLCLLFLLIWRIVNLPPSEGWQEPIDTEVLLPTDPAEVNLYYGEQKYTMTKEMQTLVLETVSEWIKNAKDSKHIEAKGEASPAAVRFEFCYNGPYRYIGSLGTDTSVCEEPFVYSSFSVGWERGEEQIEGLQMYLTPCRNGEFYDIDGAKTTLVLSLDYYADEFDDLLLKAMLDTPQGNSKDTVVESNTFPAKPDAMLVHQNGKTTVLTDSELDAAYNAFMAQTSEWLLPNRTVYVSGYAAAQALESTVIEFRYQKRQRYVPPIASDTQAQEGLVSVASAFGGREYDAILCIIDAGGTVGDTLDMEVGLYINGAYELTSMRKLPWSIKKAFLADLKS